MVMSCLESVERRIGLPANLLVFKCYGVGIFTLNVIFYAPEIVVCGNFTERYDKEASNNFYQ